MTCDWVRSSGEEHRPFKSGVVGSKPTEPNRLYFMDPHEQLTSDHGRLRREAEALKKLVSSNQPDLLGQSLQDFQASVRLHFKREDVYYRILDSDKRIPDRGLIHQLRNDHAAVIFTLESLAIRLRKNGCNEDWQTRFQNMMDVFLPHLDHEEHTLFPLGRKSLTPQEIKSIVDHIAACE